MNVYIIIRSRYEGAADDGGACPRTSVQRVGHTRREDADEQAKHMRELDASADYAVHEIVLHI